MQELLLADPAMCEVFYNIIQNARIQNQNFYRQSPFTRHGVTKWHNEHVYAD